MEISLKSSFTAFILTDGEELAGYTFNEAQKAVIQNNISAAAEEILNLQLQKVQPTDEERLAIVYRKGMIDALQYLLENGAALIEVAEEKNKPAAPNNFQS